MPAYRKMLWLRRVLPGIIVKVRPFPPVFLPFRLLTLSLSPNRVSSVSSVPSSSRMPTVSRTCSSKVKVFARS